MISSVEKVKALIRKAISTTSEEEARTCALAAVRIFVKDRLDVVTTEELEELRKKTKTAPRRGTGRGAAAAAAARRPAYAPSRTSFATQCYFCGTDLPVGSMVFWSKVFDFMACPDCFETEILKNER